MTRALTKAEVRARMDAVTRRIATDPDDRRRRSGRLSAQLQDLVARRLDDTPLGHAMVYEPFVSEPDLAPFVRWCAERGLALYHPEVDADVLRVMPGDVDPTLLDLVVVPGRAFTADGHRLGRGGGHYDRFLTRLRPDCLTVAAAYREQMVAELPIEAHDVPVAVVVTDE